MKPTFEDIYQNNKWKSDESVSGTGSTLAQTETIRRTIPKIVNKYGVQSILDIPCGDFNWFKEMDLKLNMYIGADIISELIRFNRARYTSPLTARYFEVLDITRDKLPKTDLILVRDLFGHFSNKDIKMALKNIKNSGARYLLATTFPNNYDMTDIQTGQWRPVNLDYMWGMPQSIEMINEGCTEGNGEFKDKSLGLWRL